jgi:hypothetical protein
MHKGMKITLLHLTPAEIVEADKERIVSAKSESGKLLIQFPHRKRISSHRVLRPRELN